MVCNRDCFNCIFDDCISDEMSLEEYVFSQQLDKLIEWEEAAFLVLTDIQMRYRNNREIKKQQVRKWYENNSDKKCELSRKRYRNNKEHERERVKTWYEANKERKKAQVKAWQNANKEKRNAQSRERDKMKRLQTENNQICLEMIF